MIRSPQWRQSLYRSLAVHAVLLLVIGAIYWSGEREPDDVPVEITEFIRNLGAPAPQTKSLSPKKVPLKSTAQSIPGESSQGTAAASSASSAGGGESVAEDYEVSEMPILLNEVRVPYPSAAKSKNIQGNVVFDILVTSAGAVKDLKVVSSPDAMLTTAAQNAVLGFKFRPAKMGDKFVAIRIRYTYRFLIQ